MKNSIISKFTLALTLSCSGISLLSDRAEAVIYDFNFTLNDGINSGTATGTIETIPENNLDGFGDYQSNDFSFGNYNIELAIDSETVTFNNDNSSLLIRDLENGDLTATNTGLFLDFKDPVDSNGDLFDLSLNNRPIGEDYLIAFVSFLSDNTAAYQSALAVKTSFVMDSEAIDYQLGTPRISASVPFEFSPGFGLFTAGSLWVFHFWQKKIS